MSQFPYYFSKGVVKIVLAGFRQNPVIFDGAFDWFTGMIRSSCFVEMLFRSYKKDVCDQIMSWLPFCCLRGLVKRALA